MDLEIPADAVEVGRVLGAWGVKGGIKVQPFSSDPQALFSSKRWFLRPPEGAEGGFAVPSAAIARLGGPARVIQARQQGEAVVATLHDVDDRDAAEALRGARIFVSRASFPTAAPDEFYWVDLIGLAVVNREGQALGEVTGLIETGAHSVLRIRPPAADQARPTSSQGPAASERLVPFVGAYVDQVDLARRLIVVDWGLDY